MKLARVLGQVVSTVKDRGLDNLSLLVLRETGPTADDPSGAAADGADGARTFVAVDLIGAGHGDIVLVVEGSAARQCSPTASSPTDCAVVGIVDTVIHEGTVTYRST